MSLGGAHGVGLSPRVRGNLANLCEVSPRVIEEMDAADFDRLQDEYFDFFPRGVPPPAVTLRVAAALVAHMLHTPLTALDEALVEDLLMWAEDAREVLRQSGAVRGRIGR